jgi:hypothetical protein
VRLDVDDRGMARERRRGGVLVGLRRLVQGKVPAPVRGIEGAQRGGGAPAVEQMIRLGEAEFGGDGGHLFRQPRRRLADGR